jgi:hypothetical protein
MLSALKAKKTLNLKGRQQVERASLVDPRKEKPKRSMRRQDKENSDHARQQNPTAMAAVRQISQNRKEEQERSRTKRKENEEKKLLAVYAKMQKAEARLGQDEEPSVQSTIHDEKLHRLAESNFDYNIFIDKELKELEWGACSNCQEYCFNTELEKYKGLCKLCYQNKAGRRAIFGPDNNLMPSQAPECLQRLTPVEKSAISLICPSISIYKKGSGICWKCYRSVLYQRCY